MLEIPAFGTKVRIRLLWEEAPRTCAAIWGQLPIEKPAFHGRRSGQELFVLADAFDEPGPENSVERVDAGDVIFVHLPPSWEDRHADYTDTDAGLFDIAFVYGPDALLRGPSEVVTTNLFGRVEEPDLPALAGACSRMWLDGGRDVRLIRAEG